MAEPYVKPFDRLDYTYKLMVVITLLIIAIVLAKSVIIPMAFAGILSIVMLPLVIRLEKRRIGPTLSIALVLLITMVVLGISIWLIITQIVALSNDLPSLQSKLQSFLNTLSGKLYRDFGITASKQNEMLGEMMQNASVYLGEFLLSTTSILYTFIQIPIYIFLFLIYRNKFKQFLISLLKSEEMLWKKDVNRVIRGYISGLFLVTLIAAALNSIGLLILGIDHAIFFGILSGLLTIIPYVGITIGALFPILMAVITKDSMWYAIGVIAVFAVVQFLEGNFISPRITGSKVSINALAAIIALVLGGKILGIPGMILAVPMIGLLKILLSYSTRLKPFVILLEDTPIRKKSLPPQSLEDTISSQQ